MVPSSPTPVFLPTPLPQLPRCRRPGLSLIALVLALTFGLLTACGSTTSTQGSPSSVTKNGDRPLVIATTPILGDLVRQVGGDEVDVEVLIPLGADPHDFEPSAAQAARLRDASLIVANGLGLEENLESTLEGASKDGVTVFAVGDELDPIPLPEEDAAHDEEHGSFDPHIWLDPERMATAATLVAAQLATTTGNDPSGFQSRAATYANAAKAAMAEATSILSALPEGQRKLVTNHDALEYFAQRFNLTVIGTVIPGGSTMAEPSAADIRDLAQLIKANGVNAIFSESTVSSKVIETVRREAGSQVQIVELSTDTLGAAGTATATYPGLIVTTARLIASGLNGR